MQTQTNTAQRRPISERAADIARFLGRGWSVTTDPTGESPDHACLAGPEEQGIYLSINQYGYRGRMVIRGAYPHDEHYGSYQPNNAIEITVAEARPVGQIAKEIATRFLPTYRQAYAQAQARKQETEQRIARERALMARLAPIVGATAASHIPNEASTRIADTNIYVEIFTYNGRCKLHLEDVPDEVAERILGLLNEYRASNARPTAAPT